MENTIPRRVYDFLKEYPPFNLLDQEQLLQLAERVLVQYRRVDEAIFVQGAPPGEHLYIVREGAVQLLRETEEEDILVEQCDEGDVFGLRPLLAGDQYALTARASEETLLYAVPIEGFRAIAASDPKVALYLASNFAVGAAQHFHQFKPRVFLEQDAVFSSPLLEVLAVEKSKEPVACQPATLIREAAAVMSQREVGSIIIVDEGFRPVGIVTDKDLRRRVATGQVPLEASVSDIMSSPVITVRADISMADVQIEMVRHHINHLCITTDGTDRTRVTGVISEHDLMVLQGNNPALLVREVRRQHHAEGLRQVRERAEMLLQKYLHQEVSIAFISTVMTEINDEIIRRIIALAQEELRQEGHEPPEAQFCWLALGSEGRAEQLLRTDQDSALVFDDVPAGAYKQTKHYFLALAAKVTKMLELTGFEYCPAEMMASNPQWCLSLSEWKRQFSRWIGEPSPKAVMFCTIFFDYRAIFGKTSLAEQLTEHIFNAIDEQAIFLSFLAKDALQNPPPLTFFRNFVVESSGEHKDAFDIKSRAMMPLADAARVLALHAKVGKVNNTFRRFERLAELEPQNRELYQQAADAYEILMRYRALQGLKRRDSGRFFDPAQLSKMERLNLRNSFQPIKTLQYLLSTRFQLSFFG
jgi:CBS domain-containing protein